MSSSALDPHPEATGSDNPSDERSYTEKVKKTERSQQECFPLDKVFYESKIWDVKQVDWSKKKEVWILKLQVEEGSETKQVPQGNVEIITKGPNHK